MAKRLRIQQTRVWRPVLRLYSWWWALRPTQDRQVFVLSDSTCVFIVMLVAFGYLPFAALWIEHVLAALLAFLIAPLLFTVRLVICAKGIRCYHSFLFIPFLRIRIPPGASFDLFQAWEETEPTGVSFEAPGLSDSCVDLGTSLSAPELFEKIGAALTRFGWSRDHAGFHSPK